MNYPIKLEKIYETCSQIDANEKIKEGFVLLNTCAKLIPNTNQQSLYYSLGLPESEKEE